MIFETTYTNRDITQQINLHVGPAYGVWERIKMGGIGSKRMKVKDVNPEYADYFSLANRSSFANIELRPQGIIVHFKQKLESYAWVMPFETLTVETQPLLKLSSNNAFIIFDVSSVENQVIITKIQNACS
ncbi:hypothetical protein [Marinoscillum sp. MHG1-6]|uniref:hypothetical protein n=1 Tax=Marinoscillum sp. MHG1-6 TaxID=2959627 RepID=UPI0021584841|nr:hypothetical protein [Marinoscillum sp. MHG1-6]